MAGVLGMFKGVEVKEGEVKEGVVNEGAVNEGAVNEGEVNEGALTPPIPIGVGLTVCSGIDEVCAGFVAAISDGTLGVCVTDGEVTDTPLEKFRVGILVKLVMLGCCGLVGS